MAIRRMNYTGRKKIKREDVKILLHVLPDGGLTFDAELRLKDYKLPADALVFVEAYRQTIWMRFPYGTAGAIVPLPGRRLSEFGSPEGILFRVRITSVGDREGVMLAEADKVSARLPEDVEEDRLPLLPVKPADLGSLVWRVDFTDDPILLVNRNLDWRAVTTSPAFKSLACPAAMRELLVRILKVEEHTDSEDEDDWKSKWLRFAQTLPGMSEPEDNNDGYDDWIDAAVEALARVQRLMDQFAAFWQKEEGR